MAKCFVLGGLILNFVGVILLYFGVRPNKSGVSATSVGDGGKVETDYFPRFNYLLLRLGLACLLVGIGLQMVGVYLSTIPC